MSDTRRAMIDDLDLARRELAGAFPKVATRIEGILSRLSPRSVRISFDVRGPTRNVDALRAGLGQIVGGDVEDVRIVGDSRTGTHVLQCVATGMVSDLGVRAALDRHFRRMGENSMDRRLAVEAV